MATAHPYFPGERFTVTRASQSPAAGRKVIVDGYPGATGLVRVRTAGRAFPGGSSTVEVPTTDLVTV